MLNRMIKPIMICLVVLFAANAHADIIVYDPGGTGGIQSAMTILGYTYTLKTASDNVTAADLSAGDVLVIGWNENGDLSGLDSSVWGAITGNVLLTGHDADYHTVHGTAAAGTFLDQSVQFAGDMGGVGLVALGDYSTAFSYLSGGLGITATGLLTDQVVTAFTAEGIASGVFDGLTPGAMSYWGNSYHARFDTFGGDFASFELGDGDPADIVTIGRVVPVPGAVLLGILGLSVVGAKLRRRKDG